MHAIFYAAGPAFKKGYRHHVFENINIYPLVTHILNLKPAKTDGNFNTVKEMLK
jgi:alkaline phosphatase D